MYGFDILKLNIEINTIIYAAFWFLFLAYVIFSAVLYYHWKTYAMNKKIINITLAIYFCTTIPLIMIMAELMLTL